MRIEVLDQGYVELIESWGTGKAGIDPELARHFETPDYECGIVEAARQSTQGAFRGWDKDQKLLETLYTLKHDSPFEFAGMIIEVRAPIMVFREWHRHRTQSYNEASARYAPLAPLDYVPSLKRLLNPPSQTNKQAGSVGGKTIHSEDAEMWLADLKQHYKDAEELYQRGLRYGVPKELARLPMPVGHYSQMRASANLRNWLAFMTLRCDLAAQWEIRQYAHIVAKLIAESFPNTYSLYAAGRK
jgi:thymidylate synthase (FAD)